MKCHIIVKRKGSMQEINFGTQRLTLMFAKKMEKKKKKRKKRARLVDREFPRTI